MRNIVLAIALLLAACASTSPRQEFIAKCASVGGAMTDVIWERRNGMIDQPTFADLYDKYDAAMVTCDTMLATESEARAAIYDLSDFLTAASVATGKHY